MRIAIFEDGVNDIVTRYWTLAEKHELLVHYDNTQAKWRESSLQQHLTELGLNNFTLKMEVPYDGKNFPEADLYFSDGLEGDCIQLLDHAPKGKIFFYTSNPHVTDYLSKNGHTIVQHKTHLESIIKQFEK